MKDTALEAYLQAHARPGTRRFRRGALITEPATPAQWIYLIRGGCVRTFLLHDTGTETTTSLLGPGQLTGIAALLDLPSYHCFAQAQTAVEAWAIQLSTLRGALAREPQGWTLLASALAERLAWAESHLRDVALLPVPRRVRNLRARLADDFAGQPPRLTHETIASVVAARRETVSRAQHALVPPRR